MYLKFTNKKTIHILGKHNFNMDLMFIFWISFLMLMYNVFWNRVRWRCLFMPSWTVIPTQNQLLCQSLCHAFYDPGKCDYVRPISFHRGIAPPKKTRYCNIEKYSLHIYCLGMCLQFLNVNSVNQQIHPELLFLIYLGTSDKWRSPPILPMSVTSHIL